MPTKLKVTICKEDGEVLTQLVLLSTRDAIRFAENIQDLLTHYFESEDDL